MSGATGVIVASIRCISMRVPRSMFGSTTLPDRISRRRVTDSTTSVARVFEVLGLVDEHFEADYEMPMSCEFCGEPTGSIPAQFTYQPHGTDTTIAHFVCSSCLPIVQQFCEQIPEDQPDGDTYKPREPSDRAVHRRERRRVPVCEALQPTDGRRPVRPRSAPASDGGLP